MRKKDVALIKRDIYPEIIKAAKHLFNEVGFKKTTVADIAHKLGMSQANVYRFCNSFSARSKPHPRKLQEILDRQARLCAI